MRIFCYISVECKQEDIVLEERSSVQSWNLDVGLRL